MSTTSTGHNDGITRPALPRTRRLSTETKAAYKTTEFIAYVLAVLGTLIASAVGASGDSGAEEGDPFRADKAWLFITILTVGYLLSRGLAKSGSRDFYDDDQHNH